jgi:hypothetical protein
MEINIIIFINLLAYSFIVSQSFSYIIALTDTQKNMEACTYIELRKLLDKNFRKKYKFVIYISLVSSIVLTILTSMNTSSMLFIGSSIALIALIIDIILTLKGNMPINNLINTWTKDNYPSDWKSYRSKWLSIFNKRQIVTITGFLCLLIGVIFS